MSATRICPQCNTRYEDDQRFCPLDGSTLKPLSGAADLVGSVIADRYHVISKLGEGGMGQVYLAEHVRMGRKSAVKVLHPGMVHDADAISRFNREAANASRISHPHVAAIYDFGETRDGLIYLAMEFIEGEPLTKLIERGALPLARTATIVEQTGDALAVAHELGIVHRDLKPDNIMVARNRDGSDCVKVVDFGIAKAANVEAQKVTRTGFIVGTPEYMSPEQLAGDPVDGRSDIYSLALVAFAMLTGRLPFPSETAQESMIMRLTERPRSLAEMKPDVEWPAELQSVMDRALARDASVRYASAAAFGHDFATAIGRMPRTIAARAGTHIIDTPVVRQTAVGAAPAVITEAGTARTGALARRSSRAPLIIGGATVAVGAIIALGLMESHRGGPRVAADSTALGAGAPSEPSGSDHAAATTAAPVSRGPALPNGGGGAASRLAGGATTERPLGSARGAESRSTAAAGAAALSPAAARAEIDSIRTLALGDRTAAEAVRRADVILPRLLAGNDSAEALLYQSDAYLTLGDSSRTCDALKKIGKRGNSIVRQSVVSGLSHC